MKEMYDLMDSVNQWVDDGQTLINGYKEDLPSDEQENLKKRAQVLHKLCHISCEVLNRITTPHSSLDYADLLLWFNFFSRILISHIRDHRKFFSHQTERMY